MLSFYPEMELFAPEFKSINDKRNDLQNDRSALLYDLAIAILARNDATKDEEDEFRRLSDRLNSLDGMREYREEAMGSLSARHDLVEKKNRAGKKIAEIDDSLEERKLSLGAVLFEQRSMGVLDSSIDFLDEDAKVYRKLTESGDKSFLRKLSDKRNLKDFDRMRRERYVGYSDRLFEEGKEDLVTGGKAARLISDIRSLENERLQLRNSLDEVEKRIAAFDERAGLSGEDVRKLDKSIKESESAFYCDAVAYAERLYSKAETWIDENTGEDVLSILERLIQVDRELDDLKHDEEKLYRTAKERDIRSLIDENFRRIYALEDEKKRIDEKIDSLYAEIRSLKNDLGKLSPSNDEGFGEEGRGGDWDL